ncbi:MULTISPECIES: DUF397 domain-containing protein [Actinomycetes]|uniref:DUF397 domain-containing protein n=1 Tax=Streptomyces gilvosporeus TaxID=553510 RepID=A0A1V0TSS2_9ACTN|nr:DUF397 domain-containing protein [Streptomyces gilvosporeus]ARF56009.1 DUF397 domain-containing protein [Streptomyces gilvosporeus]
MNRVDLADAAWFKSSYSNGQSACIEVADLGSEVALRDSKQNGNGPVLTSPAEGWRAFIAGVVNGEFGEL